jgi:hypothetical protein
MTDQSESRQRGGTWKIILLVIGLGAVAVVASARGLDIGGWLADVWASVTSVPPWYIALACVLKATQSILAVISWRTVLRAAYPQPGISFRETLGAYQGGVGINNVAPANAGTWVMLGLYRLVIPGSQIATLLAAWVVQGLASNVLLLLTYILLFLAGRETIEREVGSLNSVVDLVADHKLLVWVIVVGVLALVVLVARIFWTRVHDLGRQIALGGAILRTPRSYLVGAVLPVVLASVCSWGVTATFMAAFDIPVTPQTLVRVIGSHALSGLVEVTPGGIGTTQALDVLALREYAPAGTVTSFSLAQDSFLLAFNVLFGVAALAWAFGWSRALDIVTHRTPIAEQARADAALVQDQPGAAHAAKASAGTEANDEVDRVKP